MHRIFLSRLSVHLLPRFLVLPGAAGAVFYSVGRLEVLYNLYPRQELVPMTKLRYNNQVDVVVEASGDPLAVSPDASLCLQTRVEHVVTPAIGRMTVL